MAAKTLTDFHQEFEKVFFDINSALRSYENKIGTYAEFDDEAIKQVFFIFSRVLCGKIASFSFSEDIELPDAVNMVKKCVADLSSIVKTYTGIEIYDKQFLGNTEEEQKENA